MTHRSPPSTRHGAGRDRLKVLTPSPRVTVQAPLTLHDGPMYDAHRRLRAERDQALARLDSLTGDFDSVVAASLDSNADDEHDPEGATIAFERSQIGALTEQVRHHLTEIDAAVARLEAGTYGSCGRCGLPIGEARLEALPAARTCITCASRDRR